MKNKEKLHFTSFCRYYQSYIEVLMFWILSTRYIAFLLLSFISNKNLLSILYSSHNSISQVWTRSMCFYSYIFRLCVLLSSLKAIFQIYSSRVVFCVDNHWPIDLTDQANIAFTRAKQGPVRSDNDIKYLSSVTHLSFFSAFPIYYLFFFFFLSFLIDFSFSLESDSDEARKYPAIVNVKRERDATRARVWTRFLRH